MSMDTDEPDVQLVERSTFRDHISSRSSPKTETSRPPKRRPPSNERPFARPREIPQQRNRLLSRPSDPPAHSSNRKWRKDGNFFVPGGPHSTISPKSTFRAAAANLKLPLETDGSRGCTPKPDPANRQTVQPADSPNSRACTVQSRIPVIREKAEYNRRTLKEDRAKREGSASWHNPTTNVGSESRAPGHAIDLDDDGDDIGPPHSVKSVPPPTKLDEPLPSRRSRRETGVPQNQVDQKDNVARALDTKEDDCNRGAKPFTITEISYDGPRDLIFMYPPGERGNIRVTTEERERLKQHKYLNDSLIDFYLKFLEMDLKRRPPPLNFATKFFSSFFFGVLRRVKTDGTRKKKSGMKSPSIDYSGVKNWTRGFDIFSTDFVIVPICDSFHWSLIIVANLRNLESTLKNQEVELKQDGKERDQLTDPGRPKIIYLDSMDPDRGGDLAIPIRHYLVEEWLARKKGYNSKDCDNERTSTIKSFRRAIPLLKPNVPVQNNEYDCGLYVLNNLSMFLNNTESFMARMLQGDLDMKMAYGSGDITKLRKNMTFLMDLFEEEWTKRHARSPQELKTNDPQEKNQNFTEKAHALVEQEGEENSKEVDNVAWAEEDSIEQDPHPSKEHVPHSANPPFSVIEKVDLDSDERVECAVNSKQDECRSSDEHEKRSAYAPRLVVQVPTKTDDVVPVKGPPHDCPKEVDVNITSPSGRSVESRDEEPVLMECESDCIGSEDVRGSDTRLPGNRDLSRDSDRVTPVDVEDGHDDASMSDHSIDGGDASSVEKVCDYEIMETSSDYGEMEIENHSSHVNDVDNAGDVEVVPHGGIGAYEQKRTLGPVMKCENSRMLYEDEHEEIIEEGNGNDMEEPLQLVRNSADRKMKRNRERRKILNEPGARGTPGRPSPGYAGGGISFRDDLPHGRGIGRGRSQSGAKFSERGQGSERKAR